MSSNAERTCASARCRIKTEARFIKAVLGGLLGGSSALSSLADYTINSQVESAAGINRYTWTVQNQGESWGLDFFAIEVPAATQVLDFTVPQPFSNPDRIAYWIMEQKYEAWVDPHDGRVIVPVPRPRWKWLMWQGEQSSSVYPSGSTVSFSLVTDAAAKPGLVPGLTVTYTPQD